ncbi:Glycosyl transferases group 1 [Pustulibacterium marinum]|uniref:Glycosyl transferases group 1 n=1 Tax=Pustulibacterium marinum TaxID=1224947 RepID=A0A1I7F247_9FLAO|nr:glycosyltransferase [Pustulibacterium marinum]SFU30215.1 Glycosyl transferases group 1 [Pustulibacterium marinum]
MGKPKAIIFFQYLPPWRIDVFNSMAKFYNLSIAFTNANSEGFTYNREELLKRLDGSIDTIFLDNGFEVGHYKFRFGVYKLIKRIKPAIIFSHEYNPTSILLALYRKLGLCSFKYVITTSDNLSIAENVGGAKAKARKFVLDNSNGVVVYSEDVKKWYQESFKDLEVKICPNIQNPKTLLNFKNQFPLIVESYKKDYALINCNVLLYTGRLVDVKGLDLLLDAFAKSDNDNWKLVIVGEGKELASLKQQCNRLHITEKVQFVGFCSGVNLYAWYDIADFYVLPSRFEPFGAVINEALVFGVPVMASKYIGAVDFVKPDNGVLFDPLNETEFVTELNSFYKRVSNESSFKSKEDLMPVSFESYVSVFNEFL